MKSIAKIMVSRNMLPATSPVAMSTICFETNINNNPTKTFKMPNIVPIMRCGLIPLEEIFIQDRYFLNLIILNLIICYVINL